MSYLWNVLVYLFKFTILIIITYFIWTEVKPWKQISSLFENTCYQEKWICFVYPEKNNKFWYRQIGKFESLGECENNGYGALTRYEINNTGSFDCCYGCRFENKYEKYVCDEVIAYP